MAGLSHSKQRTPNTKRVCALTRADERGITGLETAIVLIAFVTVAAVFSFVILSTGLFSSERGREAVLGGLNKTRGSVEITGGLLATSDQTRITDLALTVTLSAGGDEVNLDPASTNNRTIISYVDSVVADGELTYAVTVIVGNADYVLEPGEMFELGIDLSQNALIDIRDNDTFTLEIKPPSGAYQVIQRSTPPSISATVIDLN
jgi:flagellin FlaB